MGKWCEWVPPFEKGGSGGIFPRTHATEYLLNHRISLGARKDRGHPHITDRIVG
jgi:hypothetical protein